MVKKDALLRRANIKKTFKTFGRFYRVRSNNFGLLVVFVSKVGDFSGIGFPDKGL